MTIIILSVDIIMNIFHIFCEAPFPSFISSVTFVIFAASTIRVGKTLSGIFPRRWINWNNNKLTMGEDVMLAGLASLPESISVYHASFVSGSQQTRDIEPMLV